MKNKMQWIKIGLGIVVVAVTMAIVLPALAHDDDDHPRTNWSRTKLVVENAILAGLPAGALFPFIDSTPNRIVSAHIALTDATDTCSPDAPPTPPSNLQVLVGVAGGRLVPVMTAATNTGIGSPSQCVFHVTVRPGENGVPRRITDIVVVNASEAADCVEHGDRVGRGPRCTVKLRERDRRSPLTNLVNRVSAFDIHRHGAVRPGHVFEAAPLEILMSS